MNISKNEGRLESASRADDTSISMTPHETKDAHTAEGKEGTRQYWNTGNWNSRPNHLRNFEPKSYLHFKETPDSFAVSPFLIAPRGTTD